jgi:hypothetical protein
MKTSLSQPKCPDNGGLAVLAGSFLGLLGGNLGAAASGDPL